MITTRHTRIPYGRDVLRPFLLIVSVLLLCGSTSWAYPGFNACPAQTGNASTLSCTLNNVGANHIVIFAVNIVSGTATISDTAFSLTPTVWVGPTLWHFFAGDMTGGEIGCLYTGSNSGPDTFKAVFSASNNQDYFQVLEETDGTFTSCAAALDSGGTGSGIGSAGKTACGSVTTCTSSAASSTVSGDTLFEQCGNDNSGTSLAQQSGFPLPIGLLYHLANTSQLVAYNTLGSAGSQTASCTSSGSQNMFVNMVLIRPATAANGVYIRNWTANQNMASGTGGTINLPAGINFNDYVICAASPETRPSYSTSGFSALSGWTTLLANGGVGAWGQVWSSGTATPTITAQQNNGFYEGMCSAYGGVNTSTPVDMVNDFWCTTPTSGIDCANLQVPPVFPTNTADMLVAFNAETTNATDIPIVPSNMNNRFTNASGNGPFIAGADINLTSAAATLSSTYVFTHFNPGTTNGRHSVAILLLPSSGGSSATRQTQPTVEGINMFVGGNGASTTNLYPVVGDVIFVDGYGTGTCSGAAGWTQVYNANDIGAWTHKWLNTDTTGSLGSFGCNTVGEGTQFNTWVIHNAVNPTTSPQVFSSGTVQHTSTTSDASPSIATITNSLLVVPYSAGNASSAINGTFTMPGGLFTLTQWTASSQTTTGVASLNGPANPSSSFTATNSVSGTQNSGAVDFCIVCSLSIGFPAVY